ncbi:MAG: glycosyltransferase, partial [Candidatus Sumerlaeia bacterium]|nr:glycosyltransferase [Candidatus Sumerlaeia bacterium]
MRISVVIPALDEEEALPAVLASLPRPPVSEVVVVDNGSTDGTAAAARAAAGP